MTNAYKGTLADIEDDGKLLRMVSKDGISVHPIFDNDPDKKFYAEYLELGASEDKVREFVDDIVLNEFAKFPNKIGILIGHLGTRAVVRDFTQGDKERGWFK